MSILLKIVRYFFYLLLLIVAAAVLFYASLPTTVKLDGEEKTPSGLVRNTAHYVTMRDGVDIAVDVWLPANYQAGEKLPALIRATRYGRAHHMGRGIRLLKLLGKAKRSPNYRDDIRVLNEEGYAVIKVDARGSGASFGERLIEWSKDEVADYGEVAQWITEQSWSNGRVGAYGPSYDGNTADMIGSIDHPAIIATAPQYNYFDPYENLMFPGGVFDEWFISRWSAATQAMDNPPECTRGALKCFWRGQLTSGAKPAGGAGAMKKRDQAFATRNNPTVMESLKDYRFRDDYYGRSGVIYDTVTPYANEEAFIKAGTAMNVWAGWYDSGAVDGAIARYKTLPNKQQLLIGPFSHAGKFDTDPYAAPDKPVDPSMDEQTQMLAAFFDPLLKEGLPADSVESEIRYYTYGDNAWHTTQSWPPVHIETARWHFLGDRSLSADSPLTDANTESIDYAVDFSANSGPKNRWRTIGGPDVIYADRQEEDKKLLTYTSAPLEADLEITGAPVISVNLSTTHEDGALHVYLEDVSPDGHVQYLTEGVFRLSRRAVSDNPIYVSEGPYHSHRREDAKPMEPGKVEEVSFSLYAISAIIKKGHSIRIAVAGADSAVFERVPAEGDPVITVHHSELSPSYIDLPQSWRR